MWIVFSAVRSASASYEHQLFIFRGKRRVGYLLEGLEFSAHRRVESAYVHSRLLFCPPLFHKYSKCFEFAEESLTSREQVLGQSSAIWNTLKIIFVLFGHCC